MIAETNKQDEQTLFMCGIDYEHELYNVTSGTKLYPSVEDLLADHPPAKDGSACGIVEVRVQLVRWVKKQQHERGSGAKEGAA